MRVIRVNEEESPTIWNVYGPPEGGKKNNDFFDSLSNIAEAIDRGCNKRLLKNHHIFAGDMNAKMNEDKDKLIKTGNSSSENKGFKNMILRLNLEDSFEKNSKDNIDFTFTSKIPKTDQIQKVRINWVLNSVNEGKIEFFNQTIEPTYKNKKILNKRS